MTEIDWAHRESLRMWAMLAARGHEGAQAVATYHGLAPAPPRGLPPAARTPAPVSAIAPRAPWPTVPAPVQPSPALAGISRRADMLTSLLGARPTPAAPTDLV
jgi:hypothetical protein